jgi:hypothetical protein
VAFDWNSIAVLQDPEEAYYRLLGEMLHRRATGRDLDRVRSFLAANRLSEDVWLSLGEGIFHTTVGSAEGYRMWCAWSRATQQTNFNESHQAEAWRRFQAGSSDGLEHNSEPATISMPLTDFDDGDRTRRNDVVGEIPNAIAQDAARAVALMPAGPHTVRLFDEVFEGVDEFQMLALLRGGVFLGTEVLFGARWMKVSEHPGFGSLVGCLRDQALAHLVGTERARVEVTQPGTR